MLLWLCAHADFFATWCNGCQRSYPELCKIAMDPDMQKQVKFVKVRRQGARC
jgi:thiol-disulfide isomerase/thioredoxin